MPAPKGLSLRVPCRPICESSGSERVKGRSPPRRSTDQSSTNPSSILLVNENGLRVRLPPPLARCLQRASSPRPSPHAYHTARGRDKPPLGAQRRATHGLAHGNMSWPFVAHAASDDHDSPARRRATTSQAHVRARMLAWARQLTAVSRPLDESSRTWTPCARRRRRTMQLSDATR